MLLRTKKATSFDEIFEDIDDMFSDDDEESFD